MDPIKIKPWSVNKSGEHVILWSDIKAAFGNPIHIWSGNTILPLLTDKNSGVYAYLSSLVCCIMVIIGETNTSIGIEP